ncbi:DUF1700 domain-containing protein [Paenibacillus sp. HJGM_3]|uniref:DUF1700 domain-containing protein n=1 Tax=Paenibacillus sp. HJGM_3 TaxID=3379816 RepID=UPI0038581540
MSPTVKVYLEKLNEHLRILPEEERLDAIREIESHIVHGLQDGQTDAVILAKLGDPKKLAKAYRSEYLLQKRPSNFSEVIAMIGFYSTAGLLSVILVPILGTIAYGFGFCAILILLAGLLRTFGVPWINMNLGPTYTVPTEWSMLFAAVVAGIVGAIAYISWKYLKRYLAALSDRYRMMLQSRIR